MKLGVTKLGSDDFTCIGGYTAELVLYINSVRAAPKAMAKDKVIPDSYVGLDCIVLSPENGKRKSSLWSMLEDGPRQYSSRFQEAYRAMTQTVPEADIARFLAPLIPSDKPFHVGSLADIAYLGSQEAYFTIKGPEYRIAVPPGSYRKGQVLAEFPDGWKSLDNFGLCNRGGVLVHKDPMKRYTSVPETEARIIG